MIKVHFTFQGRKGNPGGKLPSGKVCFSVERTPAVGEKWWVREVKDTGRAVFVQPIAPVKEIVVEEVEVCPGCGKEDKYILRKEQETPEEEGRTIIMEFLCLKCRELLGRAVLSLLRGKIPSLPEGLLSIAAQEAEKVKSLYMTYEEALKIAHTLVSSAPHECKQVQVKKERKVVRFVPEGEEWKIPPGVEAYRVSFESRDWGTEGRWEKEAGWTYETTEEYVEIVNWGEVKESWNKIKEWWKNLPDKEKLALVLSVTPPCPICQHPEPSLCYEFSVGLCLYNPTTQSHTPVSTLLNTICPISLLRATREALQSNP